MSFVLKAELHVRQRTDRDVLDTILVELDSPARRGLLRRTYCLQIARTSGGSHQMWRKIERIQHVAHLVPVETVHEHDQIGL